MLLLLLWLCADSPDKHSFQPVQKNVNSGLLISSLPDQNQKLSYTLTKHICIRIVPRFSFIKYVVHVWKYIKLLCAFMNALCFWNQNNVRTILQFCGLLCDKRSRRNPGELLTEWLNAHNLNIILHNDSLFNDYVKRQLFLKTSGIPLCFFSI